MNAYWPDENPFAVTKANDLDDQEILTYWVRTPSSKEGVGDYVRPRSPVPIYVLGGKGCGKTHLLRYCSYQLQKLRWAKGGLALLEGLRNDGYVGVYLLCGGLNPGRFSAKGQSPELWQAVFAFYFELWAAGQLIATVQDALADVEYDDGLLCSEIVALFDEVPNSSVDSLSGLQQLISQLKRELDIAINNSAIMGSLDVHILVSRGSLVFGIPRALSKTVREFRGLSFVYIIDQLEDLSEAQQRLVSSLVRNRTLPTTFRIGARRFGLKTHITDTDGEENLPDAEFEAVVLDDEFRRRKGSYHSFARQLIGKRIAALGTGGPETGRNLARCFEVEETRWDSRLYLYMVHSLPSPERRHFRDLLGKLESASISEAERIVETLSVTAYPLLEKVNILLLFGVLKRGEDAVAEASEIAADCDAFLSAHGKVGNENMVKRVLGHYQSDLVAQLRRENRVRHLYLGLDSFVAMSGGLPRALLTTLRNIFDWSLYRGEDPLVPGGISIESQYRGVNRSSDWFFENNLRRAGLDGVIIQSAADRLAQLFRTNRFADRPVECSLNSFSVAEHELSREARRVLDLCESRSLLNRVMSGQKHRNTKRIEMKFQLHPMLCPRWQLPLGRRGVIPLEAGVADSIFDVTRGEDFRRYLGGFRGSRTFGIHWGGLQPSLF